MRRSNYSGLKELQDLTFHIRLYTVCLPGLDRADLFVVVVHIMIVEANNGGLS